MHERTKIRNMWSMDFCHNGNDAKSWHFKYRFCNVTVSFLCSTRYWTIAILCKVPNWFEKRDNIFWQWQYIFTIKVSRCLLTFINPSHFEDEFEFVVLLFCLFTIFYQFFIGVKIVAFMIWLWSVMFDGQNWR